MEVVFATESATTAHLPVEAALRERVSCLLMCSEVLGCLHARSNSHWTLPRVEHRLYSHSSTPFESAATYTSGSAVHIGCKGTSCRILFSSSRNCCRQSVFGLPTWVLYPGWEGPLHCSGCVRVLCNAVAGGLYGRISLPSPTNFERAGTGARTVEQSSYDK